MTNPTASSFHCSLWMIASGERRLGKGVKHRKVVDQAKRKAKAASLFTMYSVSSDSGDAAKRTSDVVGKLLEEILV